MKSGHSIKVRKTEYKRVYEYKYTVGNKPNYFKAKVTYRVEGVMKHFGVIKAETAKDCALKLDIRMVELGFPPINILKNK